MVKDKSLIILPKWSMATRKVREVMQGWPNAKMSGNNKILPTAYPATLCWKPHMDQDPSEISFHLDAYERYPDQLGPLPESPTPDPVPVCQTGPNAWHYTTSTVPIPLVQLMFTHQLNVVVASPRFACYSPARSFVYLSCTGTIQLGRTS